MHFVGQKIKAEPWRWLARLCEQPNSPHVLPGRLCEEDKIAGELVHPVEIGNIDVGAFGREVIVVWNHFAIDPRSISVQPQMYQHDVQVVCTINTWIRHPKIRNVGNG